jgi:hypothetical protein
MTPDSPIVEKLPPQPSEWTRYYETTSGDQARVFTSLYGTPEDLTNEGYRRLMVNGMLWAIGLEDAITADLDVSLVGPFQPNTYGNQTHALGIRPEMYEGFESPIPANNNVNVPGSRKKKSTAK